MPKKVSIFLTNKCNLQCKHCYIKASPKGHLTFNLADVKKSLDFFYQNGYRSVEFTGGEACFSPHLKPSVIYARSLGYTKIGIDTNGTNPILFKEFTPRQIDRFTISLDGASAKTHNQLRGPKVFERCLKSIKLALSRNFRIEVIFTVNKLNLKEIPKLAHLLDDLGVSRLSFNFISAMGTAKNHPDILITPKEWDDATKTIKNLQPDMKNILLRFPKRFISPNAYTKKIATEFYCRLSNPDKAYLFPDGNIYHCCLLAGQSKYSSAHLKDHHIWNHSEQELQILKEYPDASCPALQMINPSNKSNGHIPLCIYHKKILPGRNKNRSLK
jgi:Fe-coproporphyrin III synthase